MGIMLRFAAFAALVAVAVALPAGPPAYGAPAPYHAPASHHAPAHYDESPKPYAFQYGVADSYSGAQFNAQETADGKVVSGSYSVALPDGRIQTVTYMLITTTVMLLMSATRERLSTPNTNPNPLTMLPQNPPTTPVNRSSYEMARPST